MGKIITLMDIQLRKLNLITYLAQLQDESLLNEIEEYILSELGQGDYNKPFSIEELNERIDQSLEDSKNNRVTESNELLSDIMKEKQ